jgi:hypothetical protein
MPKKNECFLDDFEALARERRFRAQVLQNRPQPHSGARISISRTTMRSRNDILKVVSSKRIFQELEKVFLIKNVIMYIYVSAKKCQVIIRFNSK